MTQLWSRLSARIRWLVPLLLVGAVAASILYGTGGRESSAGAAGNQVNPEVGNHYHAGDLDGNGRFTGQGDVWPPRPDGAGPPMLVPEATGPSADASPAIVQIAATDAAVAAELGGDWNVLQIDAAMTDGKGNANPARSEITFFSRSNNQSVVATLANGQVSNVETVDPGDVQLALTPAEVQEAVAIARAHWVAEGESAITGLEGFGILAFQPSRAHYDVRMVYVSFHENADEPPVYLSNVDLTNGQVLDARLDQR